MATIEQNLTLLQNTKATTPPTLGTSVFQTSVTNIYVPSESVAAYKAATNWSAYASKIKAIPA